MPARPERISLIAMLALLGGLLLVPPWLSRFGGPPYAYSGDEPHYLIQLHSLLEDGDLDVSNNYESAANGSIQAGLRFRGFGLDHHSSFYWRGQHHYWHQLYHVDPKRFVRDERGRQQPRLLPGVEPALAQALRTSPEYSQHPPGYPLVLAALLWPFRGTVGVERGALVLSALAVLAAALAVRAIVRSLRPAPEAWLRADLAAVAVVLGSPLWHYSRAVFSEALLAALGAGAYAVWLRGRWRWTGLLLGLGALIKPPLAIIAAPMIASAVRDGLLGRDRAWVRQVAWICAGPLVAAVGLAFLNARMFGGWGRTSIPFVFGSPAQGLWGLLFSLDRGLLFFAPGLLGAALGWLAWRPDPAPAPARGRGRAAPAAGPGSWRAVAPGVGGLLYLGLMACWKVWDGGYCYGPRLVVPAIPLLWVGVAGLDWERPTWGARAVRAGYALLVAASIAINVGPGLLAPRAYWMVSPAAAWLRPPPARG